VSSFFQTRIEFLKGTGEKKAQLFNKELSIFTFADFIQFYPFRYEDRTRIYKVAELEEKLPNIQLQLTIRQVELLGIGNKKRLVAKATDDSGQIDLIWFQGIKFVQGQIAIGKEYLVFGKPSFFNHSFSISHPEIEAFDGKAEIKSFLQPVYSTTEKLKANYLGSKAIQKLQSQLLHLAGPHIVESLPFSLLKKYKLLSKEEALWHIHLPPSAELLLQAQRRLKFEELFYIQLHLLNQKLLKKRTFKGLVFQHVPLLHRFYKEILPFELTNAQKRVIREIFDDMRSGRQMNRLLQGDVGSGKTMVAFICMLMAVDNGAQACLMAPTELLVNQHFDGLRHYCEKLGLTIALLTGSTSQKGRKIIHEGLENGSTQLLVGTHALLEDKVKFKNLGLVIVDEQHRFGVEQRSKLWQKNDTLQPHILVMTATPIPRTLAMTLYGDLDVSVIDELPANRKAIKTLHRTDAHRLQVFGFIRQQIEEGRQAYIVYPLIEESEKLDLKHLFDGYESVTRYFKEYHISIVHGRQKAKDKDFEMQRFVKGETKIMVATTVIEVGVNVPNASVMVIESAQRFGLSQLHQLRGRVGRGADQSFCILMTDKGLNEISRIRINTMVRTNNGFEIADIDLKLRGPGDLMGTRQSGALDLLIANLSQDSEIVKVAREEAMSLLESDPDLQLSENFGIKKQIDESSKKGSINWSRIG
jgi:ATP-dependent DNA helicase RecG